MTKSAKSNGGEGILKERNATLYFATDNKGKYVEAARVAKAFGITLRQANRQKVEIQSDDLKEIVSFAAKEASAATRRPIVSDDSGFFIHALGGFPGPYSSFVFKTIGNEGILKLADSIKNRRAHFQAAVAYCQPGGHPICFTGMVAGAVTLQPKGSRGFGFDPIFMPSHGNGRTFAQMGTREKNQLSHRGRAFRALFKYLAIHSRSRVA